MKMAAAPGAMIPATPYSQVLTVSQPRNVVSAPANSMNPNSKLTPLSTKIAAQMLPRWLASAFALCLVAGTFSASGVTCTWTGAAYPDANWSNAGNWSPAAPQNGDDLVFPAGPTSKSPINDIGGTLSSINSVTISDSGYDVTSSSGTTLAIVNGFSNTSSSGVSNWRIKLSLSQAQTFTTSTSGASTAFLNTWNLNGYTLTITGAGELDQTYTISGTGGISKSGTGYLSLANLGNNSYTGRTLVTGGTLFIIQESNLGGNPGGFVADQLKLDGGTLEMGLSDTIGFNNPNLGITLGSGGGTFSIDATKQLVVDNAITGPGTLTKTGAGTLKLSAANSGANTYTGKTTVLEGTLSINDENRLGANPGSFTSDQLTINGGTLNAFANFSFSNNRGVTLGASGATISVNIGNTLTIAEAITGAGSLTKTLTGTLTLSVANTYTGRTIVSAGILSINGEDRLGTNPGSFTANQLEIASGATLDAFGSFTIDDSNRGITLDSGTCTISVQPGVNLTVANVIAGSGGALTKTGTGILTLSGINTYSGATTVSAGKLIGVTGASCANSAVTISTTTSNGVVVTDNTKQWTCAGLTYNTSSGVDFNFGATVPSTTVAPLQVNGDMAFTAAPVVYIEAGALPSGAHTYPLITWTGTKSGTAPTLWANKPARIVATLTVSGKTLYLNVTGNTEPLSYYGTGSKNWGATSVWKDNTGTTATFANGDSVQMLDTVVSGSSPFTITVPSIVLPASVTVNNSTKAYIITYSTSGKISGTTALTKSGTGQLTLNLANDYSGGTTLSAGTLVINYASALGSGTLTIAGGTIDTTSPGLVLSGNAQNWNGDFTFAGASQSFNLGTGPVTLGGSRQVTVTANTLSVGGVISDNGSAYSLTKAGVGVLALTGASTYAGATTVSEGTLQIDGSTASGSAVTVNSGATLAGVGTVAGTVDVNGTIIPDDNGGLPGTLNTGAETWKSGGSYQFGITDAAGTAGSDPGWDLLSITGNLDIQSSSAAPFTINVISPPAVNFNNTTTYRWHIAMVTGSILNFNPAKFRIDTTQFQNDTAKGGFAIEQSGTSLDLVFTPYASHACSAGEITLNTPPWSFDADNNIVITFHDSYGLGTIRAVRLVNCTMTAQAYNATGSMLNSAVTLDFTSPVGGEGADAPLPDGTVKVVCVATQIVPLTAGSRNARAFDVCTIPSFSKTLDPVTTRLTIAQGGQAQQTLTGIMSVERLIQVQNGTPGLTKLTIVVNGQSYVLAPLSAGASLSLDVGAAMIPGESNTVVLLGEGAVGASATVTLGDAPLGDPMIVVNPIALQVKASAQGVQLSWPATATGYVLQSCPSLAPSAAWVNWPATPDSVSGRWVLTVPAEGSTRLFRLYRP